MVESRQASWFEKMVKDLKLMTSFELLPLFNPYELLRFARLNKACHHIVHSIVKFQLLFEAQGITLTPAEVEETLISVSKALQVALKFMMLKSITKSK
jgi:hypothetical protein